MKVPTSFRMMLCAILFSLVGCSTDEPIETTPESSINVNTKTYSNLERSVMDLVNNHRVSLGLTRLSPLDIISTEAKNHNDHMIAYDEVCHDFFFNRQNALINNVNATSVGENVAYGYSSAQAVLNAWLNSDAHKQNMEGDYSHFGISVLTDDEGKNYFTNIFILK